jgi:hypothetical protein
MNRCVRSGTPLAKDESGRPHLDYITVNEGRPRKPLATDNRSVLGMKVLDLPPALYMPNGGMSPRKRRIYNVNPSALLKPMHACLFSAAEYDIAGVIEKYSTPGGRGTVARKAHDEARPLDGRMDVSAR